MILFAQLKSIQIWQNCPQTTHFRRSHGLKTPVIFNESDRKKITIAIFRALSCQPAASSSTPKILHQKKKVIKHLLISIFSGFYVLSSVYLLPLCRADFPEQSSPKISFLVVIPFVCEASTDQDILFIL